MKLEFLTRQFDILPPDKTALPITVVGAGAIGSQVLMCLAKMGFNNLLVYDFDTVGEENISNQWFGPRDIGFLKVDALAERILDMTDTEIAKIPTKYQDSPDNTETILISAVDSMAARKEIFELAKTHYNIKYFIDPRMSAEEGQIHCVDMLNARSKDLYEKTLYSDDEAVSEACTAKATMYCSMFLASQVAKMVKDIATDQVSMRTFMCDIKKNDFLVFKN